MSSEPAALPRFIAPANGFAFAAVSAAGLVGAYSTFVPVDPAARAVAIAIGAAYAIGGPAGAYVIERRGTRRALHAFFAVLVAAAVAVDVLTRGSAALLFLAVVSASVLYLRPALAAATTALAFGTSVAFYAVDAPSPALFLQAAGSYTAALAFVLVFSRMALVQHRQRAEVERLAGELSAANERLTAYSIEVERLAAEAERSRIAREIHDGLGHALTVVHVQLEAAQALLDAQPARARAAIEQAQRLAHEGLNDVRRSVALLRGAAPPGPLAASIE
ncbi:MAG TPA: histidine kinase, partial [Minicystis sp.]|nr:histidine kinase [Minicystis sp.]